MTDKHYRSERLCDSKVLDLLQLCTLPAEATRIGEHHIRELMSLPVEEFKQRVRSALNTHGLTTAHLSCLEGVSELTARRWLASTRPLPEAVREKLARLCLLLSRAGSDEAVQAAGDLIQSALDQARNGRSQKAANLWAAASARVFKADSRGTSS